MANQEDFQLESTGKDKARRGKRCGARNSSANSNAKKSKVNQEIPPAVGNQENFELELTGKDKVMEPNRFVDFEAVLRSSDIQLPTSQSQPPQQEASIIFL